MGILRLLLLSSLLITTAVVESRPISWSGGSTLMYKTNSMMSSYYYHFSPSYQYSIGAEYINDRYFNEQYINIRSTYLLDRKNTKSSQRNLYLTGAVSTKKVKIFTMEYMVIGKREDTSPLFQLLISIHYPKISQNMKCN